MPRFRPIYHDEDIKEYRIPEGNVYTQAMNCCLHDHLAARTQTILEWYQVKPTVCLDSFYFCLTGLKKSIYSTVYGVGDVAYLELYDSIHHRVKALLHQFGCRGDVFMVLENDIKQIAVLFSGTDDSVSAEALAGAVGQAVQAVYEKQLFLKDRRYCNVTALSGQLHGFSDIQQGYLQARALSDLSFFRMTTQVLTAKEVEVSCNEADYQVVIDACIQLAAAVDEGDAVQTELLLEKLFLDTLRGSYSLTLCRDALSFIKGTFQVRCAVYGLVEGLDLESLCAVERYLKIEECQQALLAVFMKLCKAVRQQGPYSKVVLHAAYYVKKHYTEDISLPDVAHYANVNPSYLSSHFKKIVGVTLREYITQTRIERAKSLLLEENKIIKVAAAVGINDHKQFTRVFKRLVGITPAEYRMTNL